MENCEMRKSHFASSVMLGLRLGIAVLYAVVICPAVLAEEDLSADLKKVGYKIVYETFQDGTPRRDSMFTI